MEQIFLNLSSDKLAITAKALSSPLRIEILKLLRKEELNVNEIAEKLEIPASTAALNIKVLEEAELIFCELQPGVRGSMKLCRRIAESCHIELEEPEEGCKKLVQISMPIGNYVDYKVEPTCGMVNEYGPIDEEDEPRCFYNPQRITAKLLWFGAGYVEYRFSNADIQKRYAKCAELSMELCSETADYDLECKSDITVWVNGLDAGTWHSPSDFGGRRGKLNPDWWQARKTQYGNLKTWKMDEQGTFLDDEKVSNQTIGYYQLEAGPYISVRIGIKETAKHIGGVNIFGDRFGDFPQDIVLKLEYE